MMQTSTLVALAGCLLLVAQPIKGQQGPDAQDRLDKTLRDHPEFDTARPERAVVDKVKPAQPEVLPDFTGMDTKGKNAAETRRLEKKRADFIQKRVREMQRAQLAARPAESPFAKMAATAGVATEGGTPQPTKAPEPKTNADFQKQARAEWEHKPEAKKLRELRREKDALPVLPDFSK